MSKFNQTNSIKTVNRSGNQAYAMTDKAKLVTQVLTSFFNEAKFYGDNSEELVRTLQAVIKTDPAFVASLAVVARREFHMRSVAHVLTGYLAHEPEGKPYVRHTVKGVALRGDDLTEIMSFYLATFGKPIPNSLKKGIADVLGTLDEYTLAKYKGSGKSLKMKDLFCLCRPLPKDEAQSAMWKRCLEDKLAVPVTWETQLSAKGNKAATWEALIDSGKVGYMALLRNLRNILQARPRNIDKVWRTIADPEAVRRSQQLPFRFLSAYKEINQMADSRALEALEDAARASVANMPRWDGTTVIAVDVSGSMGSRISAKSEVRCFEIAVMLGLMANQLCDNSIFYIFNDKIHKVAVSRKTGILYAATHFEYGGFTNMYLPFEKMITDKVEADRIIILSDNECNATSTWGNRKPVQVLADEYREKSGRDIWVHAVDLEGYGTQQFHGPKTNIIAGWSERALDFIRLAEQGEGSLMASIEAYEWE